MKRIALISLLCLCLVGAVDVSMPYGVVSLADFQSLQAAVDAVPNGGTILVPRGIWEGDATIPAGKYIHIRGVSPGFLGQCPFLGSGQWDYLLTYYPDTFLNGSILRGQINATARASKLALTDLLMIGHGAGVAVAIGANEYMTTAAPIQDVHFGNYSTAVQAIKAYHLTIERATICGTQTALIIRDGNLNTLTDVHITYADLAADLKGEIFWRGGSVHTSRNGIQIYQTAGYMGGVHFEDIKEVSLFWDGYGGKLDPNYYASNSGKLVINGYNNILDIGWVVKAEFTAQSKYNFATLFGPYTNLGYDNRITTR